VTVSSYQAAKTPKSSSISEKRFEFSVKLMRVVEPMPVRVVEMVPAAVVEIVPVRVVEMVPVRVVEIVPPLVVEMVPGFAIAEADIVRTRIPVKTIG
jgi:hypothetical protein